MLEKLGLPAKPSARGSNWVIDASHCQGCSAQFTFLNRKHHCRRCGGLFCNSCTQQRMILRGQGDSPVRICDPCKKLEEAARFEIRYGHRNRAIKGSLKASHKPEDEVLNQILGADGKQTTLSGRKSAPDMVSDIQRTVSSASCSNAAEEAVNLDREGEPHGLDEIESHSPEKLRQQAQEEKKKYSILKKEGNPGEALRAFKRGKELERQAEALELALRKNRRNNSQSSSLLGTQKSNDALEGSVRKTKLLQETGKGKDDLAVELKALGWSDADLHDEVKKPAKISLEGELSNIIGENPKKSSIGREISGGVDKSQVIEHKRKALMFKREGKLVEAKEELKRAKILEKQLEEQEYLVQDESDDELSSLIQGMDDDKEDMTIDFAQVSGFNLGNIGVDTDDLTVDDNFEVTDDDMNDPEIAAALRSFGWSEDAHQEEKLSLQSASVDREALQRELLALKREALNQKRAGNVAEAMVQLKKAKLLEKDLEKLMLQGLSNSPQISIPAEYLLDGNLVTETTVKSTLVAALDDNNELMSGRESIKMVKAPQKSRAVIQRELLGLKKKALALRREGKLGEAEEELRKCKVLEDQLKEVENPLEVQEKYGSSAGDIVLGEEDVDVSEQDLHDPALLSVLKNFGWNEEEDDDETSKIPLKYSKQINSKSESASDAPVVKAQAPRKKAEIQKELLGLKRKALLLRRQGKSEEAEEELRKARTLENQLTEMELRQGKSEEAEEELRKARTLENQLTEMELPQQTLIVRSKDEEHDGFDFSTAKEKHSRKKIAEELAEVNNTLEDPTVEVPELKPITTINETETKPSSPLLQVLQTSASSREKRGIVDEILSVEPVIDRIGPKAEISDVWKKNETHEANLVIASDSLVTRTQQSSCVQEILAHKRKAVALKREGKLAEAREELQKAKILERSLEDDRVNKVNNSGSLSGSKKDVPNVLETRKDETHKPLSSRDRFKLQQESLAHKRQALKLRREGRIEESEAEFELAKSLEMQMESGGHESKTQNSVGEEETMADGIVDDLLDPQLLSALKAIGWQESDIFEQKPGKSDGKIENLNRERAELEEKIKAEKVQALNLKRAGKQGEALEALRRAKAMEKKLNMLAS